MKILMLLGLSFLSVVLNASITDVKVTSFRSIGSDIKDKAAELCGKVTFVDEKLIQLIVTSDPKQNPGDYSTFADSKGNFCVIIATYTGQASVSAVSQISGASVPAVTFTQADFGPSRQP